MNILFNNISNAAVANLELLLYSQALSRDIWKWFKLVSMELHPG